MLDPKWDSTYFRYLWVYIVTARGFDRSNENLNRFDVVRVSEWFYIYIENDNIGLVVGAFFYCFTVHIRWKYLNKIVSQLYIGMAGRYTALTSLAQGATQDEQLKTKIKLFYLQMVTLHQR